MRRQRDGGEQLELALEYTARELAETAQAPECIRPTDEVAYWRRVLRWRMSAADRGQMSVDNALFVRRWSP